MQDFLLSIYDWLRALHVIAVISWMAGMLYLPRLFVYHADAKPGSEQSETFKIMERRLYKYIMTPAMIVTWLAGLSMLYANPGLLSGQGWMHAKLLLVFLLSGVHGAFGGMLRKFANDTSQKSAKFFRIVNEIPTLLMVVIVVLVIVRPF